MPPISSTGIDLAAGSAAEARTVGSNEVTQAGYAKVAVESGEAPYGTAVFSFKQSGVTVSEAGVPASPPTTRARLFIDYRSGVTGLGDAGTVDIDTGIAIVNYSSATANITYTLRNVKGTRIAGGRGTLAAGAHFAKFIDQLKEVAPGFNLPPDFPTGTGFGSLEISSDQPVSVVALRETLNQRHDPLVTTTPIADLTQSVTADPIYFPSLSTAGGTRRHWFCSTRPTSSKRERFRSSTIAAPLWRSIKSAERRIRRSSIQSLSAASSASRRTDSGIGQDRVGTVDA